jgi:hypothetical protein
MDDGIGAQAETLPATRQARKQRINLSSHGGNRRFKPCLRNGVIGSLQSLSVEAGALCVEVRAERRVQGRNVASDRGELRVVKGNVPPKQQRHGERRHAERPK